MMTNYAAFVALDWGDQQHGFALQTAAGQSEDGTLAASAESLHGWLEQLQARFAGQPVALTLEAGKNAVVHALLGHPWLTLYPIHTAASENFRKALVPSGAKDDVSDARVLLRLLIQHRDTLRSFTPDDPATQRLEALVQLRRGLVDQRTSLGQELLSTLKLYFPQALELIGDNHTAPLALDFLARWPDLPRLQAARATKGVMCEL